MKLSELRKIVRSVIKEAEEEQKPTGNQNQPSTSFNVQTSFPKDINTAKEVVKQLQSGDPNSSILKASDPPIDPKKAKEWVEKIGPDVVAQRIVDIGAKIPSTGLAKKDMPFLPGPKDAKGSVDDVEDAVTPGGKYNVDFKEVVAPPAPNALGDVDTDDKAKDFMSSGTKDGKPDDDKATFQKGATIAASKAIPTQTNILLGKSLSMAIGNGERDGVAGGDLGAYISTKGEILDGHHRWAATMLNNPNASIGSFAAVDLDAMGGKEKALKYLTAIGNALGNKTKTQEAQIKEAKRFQKLAGILKEDATSAPAPAAPAAKQTADVAGLTKMIQSNSSLMNKLKTVNSGQEVTETLAFILNNINPKASGVNKTKLKSIIDQRFK